MSERIDVYLYEHGFAQSRQKARLLVMAGAVFVNGAPCAKPSCAVPKGAQVFVRQPGDFVSRGGKKLQKALRVFDLRLDGVVAIDVGASTGGFTDCMLKSGAAFVYAVDVGYGQLAWSLRQDGRVRVMERQNARYLERGMFDKPASFSCIDVSFISLKLILPAVAGALHAPFTIVALIKPQFEAGRGSVGKKGVVRDPAVHAEVIGRVLKAAEAIGLCVSGLDYSPIRGPEGNIEYLACFRDSGAPAAVDIRGVVEAAHTGTQGKFS